MSSFQKMKLVEENELLRLKDKQIRDYNPQIRSMTFTQSEIDDILMDNKLSAEEKLLLINAAEKRYKGIKSTLGASSTPQAPVVLAGMSTGLVPKEPAPPLTGLPAVLPGAAAVAAAPDADDPVTQRVMRGVPVRMKKKAKEMFEYIKDYPDLINFNDKTMEVSINGQSIKHSNFLDLFRSLYSSRRNYTPVGSAAFLSALSDINAPTSLISNRLALSDVLDKQNLSQQIPKMKSFVTKKFSHSAGTKRRRLTASSPPGRLPHILQIYAQ